MNNLHKLFKEMQELSIEDFDLLCDAWREYYHVKRQCKHMGIKYSDKRLANYVKNSYSNNKCVLTTAPAQVINNTKKIEKIILGDNLDVIEEAARKKGLL